MLALVSGKFKSSSDVLSRIFVTALPNRVAEPMNDRIDVAFDGGVVDESNLHMFDRACLGGS